MVLSIRETGQVTKRGWMRGGVREDRCGKMKGRVWRDERAGVGVGEGRFGKGKLRCEN